MGFIIIFVNSLFLTLCALLQWICNTKMTFGQWNLASHLEVLL